MKRLCSVLLVFMILSVMIGTSAVSSSAFSGEIKFEVGDLDNAVNKFFYAHIWNGLPGGSWLYGWQTKEEKLKWIKGDAVATYNVPEGDWNLIIISSNSGFQTYDTVFNASCIGDTCYVMDETFKNPIDFRKEARGLSWRNNPDCGPHKVVSSLGEIIGTAFLPGENNQTIYDDFVKRFDINNVSDPENNIFNWNDDGAVETGKDWETIKHEVAEQLNLRTGDMIEDILDNNNKDRDEDEDEYEDENSSWLNITLIIAIVAFVIVVMVLVVVLVLRKRHGRKNLS